MTATRILDTTISDTGAQQNIENRFLRSSKPLRFSADLADGDVLKVYGRANSNDDWNELQEFSGTTTVMDIYPSSEMKADRTTDGGNGDSEVFIENPFGLSLTAHI